MHSSAETQMPTSDSKAGQLHYMAEHTLHGTHGPMRYWIARERRGMPLVLIHGYGALIEHWRRLLPLLRDHTPCVLDLYNFGYSSHMDDPPSIEGWVEQVAQLIEHVYDEPVVVIGHSLGGMVAGRVALDHPQLVRGVVFVNSMGLPMQQPSPVEHAIFRAIRAPVVGDMLAAVIANTWMVRRGLEHAYHHAHTVTPELVEAFSGPLRKPGGAKAYLAVTRALHKLALDVQPGDIQQPALLVWGQEDQSMPSDLATRFRREIVPQAEAHVIPQTGHCPFDEDPQAFAEVLLPWLARLAQE
jgi:pimeloyl-ACP methyl ester carboxylesterase